MGRREVALLGLVGLAAALGLAWLVLGERIAGSTDGAAVGSSGQALAGKVLFDANCAQCHGEEAMGSERGPPLVHAIYEPGHHGDAAFHRAVSMGTPAHHWPFGDMPPVEGLSEDEVEKIIAYVRGLQRAAGIE